MADSPGPLEKSKAESGKRKSHVHFLNVALIYPDGKTRQRTS
jgi:hypothetical protein